MDSRSIINKLKEDFGPECFEMCCPDIESSPEKYLHSEGVDIQLCAVWILHEREKALLDKNSSQLLFSPQAALYFHSHIMEKMKILPENAALFDFKMYRDLETIVDMTITNILTAIFEEIDVNDDACFSSEDYQHFFDFLRKTFSSVLEKSNKWFLDECSAYCSASKFHPLTTFTPDMVSQFLCEIHSHFMDFLRGTIIPSASKEMEEYLELKPPKSAQLRSLQLSLVEGIAVVQGFAVIKTPSVSIDLNVIGKLIDVDKDRYQPIVSGNRKVDKHKENSGRCIVFIPVAKKNFDCTTIFKGKYEIYIN